MYPVTPDPWRVDGGAGVLQLHFNIFQGEFEYITLGHFRVLWPVDSKPSVNNTPVE